MSSGKRVCLVTGASGRLGTEFCAAYASRYTIIALYHTHVPEVPSQISQLVDPLKPHWPHPANAHPVYVIQADLTLDAEIERVLEIVATRVEGIDLLVHAAAQIQLGDLCGTPPVLDQLLSQFVVNVGVPVKLSAAVANRFWRDHESDNRERNRNIVMLSSVSGSRVFAHRGQSVYAASKAALNQLTRHMAEEFATFGVRVNAIAPTTFPQIVPTEQVADAIIRLDEGTMTGEIVTELAEPVRG